MTSYFGIIALSGVVVNDSLVLVDFVNRERATGVPLMQAVKDAAKVRFRAILLTSLTTFLGLVPITIFETSLQAQLVIPMAASLAFGILFATVITLFLIPTLYLLLDDFKDWWKQAWAHVLQRKTPLTEARVDAGPGITRRPEKSDRVLHRRGQATGMDHQKPVGDGPGKTGRQPVRAF